MRCLCFSATSTLSELIFPTVGAKAAHGVEALQAFVAVRRDRLGEDHSETCLFVEQLVLACSSIGLLHAMAGEVEPAERFLASAEQALQTSGVSNAVGAELKLVLYSAKCQLACIREESSEALRFAEMAHHEATRSENPVGEAGAEMLLAYVHGAFGDFDAARDILESTLGTIRGWNDMVLVATNTMAGAETSGMLQLQCPRACIEAICMYNYVVCLVASKDATAVKAACEALELMLSVFDASSSTGALYMFEHLFKVAAGASQGTLEVEVSLPVERPEVQARCNRHLQVLQRIHRGLTPAERVALAPPRDGLAGNSTPNKLHGKRRLMGVVTPQRLGPQGDDAGWLDGPVARAVQAVYWGSTA